MESVEQERTAIRQLVRELGAARGARAAATEEHLFVTGFQPARGVDYVEEKGGFWVWRR